MAVFDQRGQTVGEQHNASEKWREPKQKVMVKTPRQSRYEAIERAMRHALVRCVEKVGEGVYVVPSQRVGSEEDYVVVHHGPGLRPEHFKCGCPAGENGNPICAHWAAVALHLLTE